MLNRKLKNILILICLVLINSFRCVDHSSNITDQYLAEKMYYKAGKIQSSIMINPAIALPLTYKQAELAYREIIEKFNKKSETKGIVQQSWLDIAKLYLLQEKYNDAIKIYEEIIQTSSDKELCAIAQYAIASSYEKMKQYDAAIRAYKKLTEKYSPVASDTLLPNMDILKTPNYIARMYQQMGKPILADQHYQEAFAYYQHVVQQWPNTEVAFAAQDQVAMAYLDQGNWLKAAGVLEETIERYRNNHDVFDMMFTLGKIYEQNSGDLYRALDIYNRLIHNYPKNENLGQVYLAKGGIYIQQNNYNKARAEFKFIVDNFPKDANTCIQAQMAIGKSYELENNWLKALNEYQWVFENYQGHPQVLDIPLYIANYYKMQGEKELAHSSYETAAKKYQQLIDKFPQTPVASLANDYLATSYVNLERWQEACLTLEELVKMKLPAQKQVNAYLALGGIYDEKLHHPQKAIAIYKQLKQTYPELPFVSDIDERIKKLQVDWSRYQLSNNAPQKPVLISAMSNNKSSTEIQWRRSDDHDFQCYKLYRSESQDVDSTDHCVARIYNQQQTKVIDEHINGDNGCYYRLYVFDQAGLSAASDQLNSKIQASTYKGSIQMQVQGKNWNCAIIHWSPAQGNDFDSYKIYRSLTPNVTLSSQLLKSIFDRSITQFDDTELKEQTTYYYKVFVFNPRGENQPSNEAKLTTSANVPPAQIMLSQPSSGTGSEVRLNWSLSHESDFAMYRLLRSEQANIAANVAPIWMSSNPAVNNFTDSETRSSKTYYYKIVVYDKGGLFTESNEVKITL